eukprot:461198_1
MIIFAKCNEDIQLVIDYANMCNYKVMTRSGGHQCDSGLSSCNSNIDDCIQIDMSNYNKISKISRNDQITSASIEVEACPGTQLKYLNKKLKKWDVFLPHGDCKYIGLGGHISTGGQGHIHNQFSQVVDHVIGFDIILSNGEFVSVCKPSNWQINIEKSEQEFGCAHPFNDLLYFAVLGGSPGSYGVVLH